MNINHIIRQLVGIVSQIGSLFGNYTGLQIGGPLVTGGIIVFLLWKFWGRFPKWVKIALVIVALSMFSGSLSNILQQFSGALK